MIPDFTSTNILVFGDIMLDRYVWGAVERISPEAPIPVVHVRDRTCRLGGAGNVAANLAGIGCKTTVTGIVGKDPSGKNLADLLLAQGIENACVSAPNLPTVTKTRIMGGAQQIVRLDDEQPGMVDASLREKVFKQLQHKIKKINAVVVSDYGKGLLDDTLAKECISLCREHRVPVFVDPKRDDWAAYAGATCITPNLKEFQQACRQLGLSPTPMDLAAQTLVQHYGLDHLLITQGNAGMTLTNKEGTSSSVPSRAREVFDVSGAGDTVIALLAAAFAAGSSMEQAMHLANLGAGEVVGRVGTYALTRADLEQAAALGAKTGSAACSLPQAQRLVEHWRMLSQKVVFTNGCFDILHPGHVSLLQRAKNLGHRLIVGLNTDASVRRIKGPSRPILAQEDRAALLSALSCVDAVVFFDEDTPLSLLQALRPDILVKGADYTPETVVGAELMPTWGGRVEILDLVEERSTTAIVEKIRNGSEDPAWKQLT